MKVREKIETYGANNCTVAELLDCAVGTPGVVSSISDLQVFIEDLTPARKGQMKAMLELVKRLDSGSMKAPFIIHGPDDAAVYARAQLKWLNEEHFCVMLLNTKNRVIRFETVSIGGLNSSIVHPRETFRPAIIHHAASLILVHNHPSGDPEPSREDIKVTERLVQAGKILGIPVMDHIILGDKQNFVSLKDKDII